MTRLVAAGALVLAIVQAAQQQSPPPRAPRPQSPGVFPAMQRPAADPAVIERGKAIFGASCAPCHGADARGGQLNGPNLLRSQLVLADHDGETISPVIQSGRPERGMPPFPLGADDVKAVVEFIHSLTAASPGQGMPPRGEAPPPDIVVGDAAAGQTYFASHCVSCHRGDKDLSGIATRVPDAKTLQNLWVSGGTTGQRRGRGGRGRGGGGGEDEPRGPVVTATVTLPSGEVLRGPLAFIDDFEIKIAADDGSIRSLKRSGDVPRVEIADPLQGHKELLSALTDKDMRDVTAYLVTLK
jgi:cytochrome c oxidase cbb3-type subunit III